MRWRMARPGGGFSATGLPNEVERLPTLEPEAHAIHGPDLIRATPQDAAMDREILPQVLNVEERLRVEGAVSLHRGTRVDSGRHLGSPAGPLKDSFGSTRQHLAKRLDPSSTGNRSGADSAQRSHAKGTAVPKATPPPANPPHSERYPEWGSDGRHGPRYRGETPTTPACMDARGGSGSPQWSPSPRSGRRT